MAQIYPGGSQIAVKKNFKNTSCTRIQLISMAKKHAEFNTKKNKSWKKWKSVVKINEKFCIQKNNGKSKK